MSQVSFPPPVCVLQVIKTGAGEGLGTRLVRACVRKLSVPMCLLPRPVAMEGYGFSHTADTI